MDKTKLDGILSGIDRARVALIGDMCLDAYWDADMTKSELSRETPQFPLPVVGERYSPGGAGNAANNVAALNPAKFTVMGAAGEDWRGDQLLKCFRKLGIDTASIIRSEDVVTNTYIKPMRHGVSDVVYEDPRLDFENRRPLPGDVEERLLAELAARENDFDVLLVCDQMKFGCITSRVRELVCEIGASGKKVIVDSRDRISEYSNVIVKPNEVEASRNFADGTSLCRFRLTELVRGIETRTGRPAIITIGEDGALVCERGVAVHVPAVKVEPPIDICGAGDTFLAALGCAVAGGAGLVDAAQFGSLASSVTIAKVGMTGTATRAELASALEVRKQKSAAQNVEKTLVDVSRNQGKAENEN